MNNQPRPIVAAFDFDGTVSYRDTLLPFIFFVHGYFNGTLRLLSLLPTFILYVFGSKGRQETKEAVLARCFSAWSLHDLRRVGASYAKERLPALLRPEALSRLQWHLGEGHRCVLVSASLDIYLEPWTRQVGFDDLLSSRLMTDAEGLVSGKLVGRNCWGAEKIRLLEDLLGPREDYQLYAYGDSRGDYELLESADWAFYREMPA